MHKPLGLLRNALMRRFRWLLLTLVLPPFLLHLVIFLNRCPLSGLRGHVFILHGDTTRLTCDARLIPCDAKRAAWSHAEQWGLDSKLLVSAASSSGGGGGAGSRVHRLSDWKRKECVPYLVEMGERYSDSSEGISSGARRRSSVTGILPRSAPSASTSEAEGGSRFVKQKSKWYIDGCVEFVEAVRSELAAQTEENSRMAVSSFCIFL